MQTSILNEFLSLVEQHSFSKAARQLSISQATLSRHIQSLEEELGVPLFERTTQKMNLTPYGEAFVEHACAITEAELSCRKAMERIKFKTSSHLAIGTVDYPYFYGITSLFASFKKLHQNASIEVNVASTDDLLKMLEAGKIDVAFLRNLTDLTVHCNAFFYHEDFLSVAVPVEHPMAQQRVAQLSSFAQDTFYSRFQKGGLMDRLETSVLRAAGFEPKRSMAHGTWDDSVINGGKDISIVTQGLAGTLAGNIHLKLLTLDPPVHTDIWVASRKDRELSDIAACFWEHVHSHLPKTHAEA